MTRNIFMLIILLCDANLTNGQQESTSLANCNCTINVEETAADCSNKGLTTIPDCIPNTTQSLIFEDNLLTYRSKQFERFKFLVHLDLTYNSHYCPDNYSILGLSKLKVLSLNWNSIHSLQRYAFAELSSLENLSLAFNYIVSIRNDSFGGLVNLRFLDLCGNSLSEIRNYQFSGLSKLLYLDLTNSFYLKNLYNHSFSGLQELKHFSLGTSRLRMAIESIDLDTFQPFTRLEELSLHRVCMGSGPGRSYNCSKMDKILSIVPSLKKLHLDKRFIDNLGPGFALLKNLEELYFHGKYTLRDEFILGPLREQTFTTLNSTRVSKLVIDHIKVKGIHAKTFACLKHLTSLELVITISESDCSSVYYNFAVGLNKKNIKHIRLSVKCLSIVYAPSLCSLNHMQLSLSTYLMVHFIF